MRISDWSSDVCSSDLRDRADGAGPGTGARSRGELDASARAHRHVALYAHPADGRADDRALSRRAGRSVADRRVQLSATGALERHAQRGADAAPRTPLERGRRSEEHTTEIQSLKITQYANFCMKKNKHTIKK